MRTRNHLRIARPFTTSIATGLVIAGCVHSATHSLQTRATAPANARSGPAAESPTRRNASATMPRIASNDHATLAFEVRSRGSAPSDDTAVASASPAPMTTESASARTMPMPHLLDDTTSADANPQPGEALVRAPQFVLIGLDATPGPDTEHTFSRRVGDAAERAGGRITYFINTQNFLLNPDRRHSPTLTDDERPWLDPRPGPIRRISYARSIAESHGRLSTANYLVEHGHELASHSVHHERGRAWTLAQWRAEFALFARYQHDLLGLPPVMGFRAPYLAWNREMNVAEAEAGMLYDASRVSMGRVWPERVGPNGLWSIPVFSGRIGRCRALIFDDGIRGCRATDEDVYQSLRAEFDARYDGTRAPLVLSSHDGYVESVYIRILEDVCRLPDVRCVTFATLARYMNNHPEISGYGRRMRERGAPSVAPER